MHPHRARQNLSEATRGAVVVALAFASILTGSASLAAEEDLWAGVEEMLVVGDGGFVVETIIPTSAIEFDAETLKSERIEDIGDLSNLTPNLQINQPFAASNPVIFIRGVGLDDFNANSVGAVAIYQDGIYMNSPAGQLFQFFDVGGVSVLRGPQGGKFRNASAGVIMIESVKPSHEVDGFAEFTYGNYDLVEGKGAINVPIIPDVLAMRTSMTIQKRDGYTKNRCNGKELTPLQTARPDCTAVQFPGFNLGFPEQIHNRVNDADNFAVRSQLLYDVPLDGSAMQWLLNVHGGQNRSQATQYQHRGVRRRFRGAPLGFGIDVTNYQDTDGDPFAGAYNTGGDEKLDLIGASLKGTWEIFDGHTIVSLSGYEWHDRDTLENTDASPRSLLVVNYTDEAWQFSQDLRLESDWTDTFRTSIGAYFIMEDLEANNAIDQQNFSSSKVLTQDFDQETRSYSFYGSLSWDDFFYRFSFDGTIRYTREYKRFENSASQIRRLRLPPDPPCNFDSGGILVSFNNVIGCQNGNNLGSERAVFRGNSGSASLSYDILADGTKRVYFKYSRGWKPGHFNGGAFTSRQLIEPIDPETVDSWEGGFNTSWFDGKVKVDAAAFYYEFEDMQVFQIESDIGVGPIPQLINAQGAEIMGVELDLEIEPIEGLVIRFNGAYLDTEYSEFTTELAEPIPPPPFSPPGTLPTFLIQNVDYTGNRMLASPEWSLSGSVQYTIPLGRFGEVTPRFSYTFRDDVYFDVAEGRGIRDSPELRFLPKGTIGQESFWLFHANLVWRLPGDAVEIRGWVRNITEEEYRVQSFDLTDPTFRMLIDAYGAPRTFGVTTTLKF